jgi:hypothetical protein
MRGAVEITGQNQQSPARENLFLSIGFNLLLPVLLLKKGGAWLPGLQDWQVLALALVFPVTYFVYDLVRRWKYNFISILGFVSVLLTGGIGLLQLNPFWIAVKEAAIPGIIGLVLVGSLRTPYPVVQKLFYNPEIINVEIVRGRLMESGKQGEFEQLLTRCTWLLGASFFVSAILNFVLARIIVRTNPAENGLLFNQELGALALWSWPVIVVPCTAVMMFAFWQLFKGIKRMTGLELEEVFRQGRI